MDRTEHRKLVTIVAEAVLAEAIVVALERAGVSGYTMTDARGKGSRGRRTGEIPGEDVAAAGAFAARRFTTTYA